MPREWTRRAITAPKEVALRRGLSHSAVLNHTWRARRLLGYKTVLQMMFELGKECQRRMNEK